MISRQSIVYLTFMATIIVMVHKHQESSPNLSSLNKSIDYYTQDIHKLKHDDSVINLYGDCGSSGTRLIVQKNGKICRTTDTIQLEIILDTKNHEKKMRRFANKINQLMERMFEYSQDGSAIYENSNDSCEMNFFDNSKRLDYYTFNIYLLSTAGSRFQIISQGIDENQYKQQIDQTQNLIIMTNKFNIKQVEIVVISGDYEGLFAWIALLEKLQKSSEISKDYKSYSDLCGNLSSLNCAKNMIYYEVGGSSAQLVYIPQNINKSSSQTKIHSISYLGLGQNSVFQSINSESCDNNMNCNIFMLTPIEQQNIKCQISDHLIQYSMSQPTSKYNQCRKDLFNSFKNLKDQANPQLQFQESIKEIGEQIKLKYKNSKQNITFLFNMKGLYTPLKDSGRFQQPLDNFWYEKISLKDWTEDFQEPYCHYKKRFDYHQKLCMMINMPELIIRSIFGDEYNQYKDKINFILMDIEWMEGFQILMTNQRSKENLLSQIQFVTKFFNNQQNYQDNTKFDYNTITKQFQIYKQENEIYSSSQLMFSYESSNLVQEINQILDSSKKIISFSY